MGTAVHTLCFGRGTTHHHLNMKFLLFVACAMSLAITSSHALEWYSIVYAGNDCNSGDGIVSDDTRSNSAITSCTDLYGSFDAICTNSITGEDQCCEYPALTGNTCSSGSDSTNGCSEMITSCSSSTGAAAFVPTISLLVFAAAATWATATVL